MGLTEGKIECAPSTSSPGRWEEHEEIRSISLPPLKGILEVVENNMDTERFIWVAAEPKAMASKLKA